MYDAQQYIVYAQANSQGNLIPSNILKGLRYSKAQTNILMQIREMTDNVIIQRAATGNVKVLCVLAAFSNKDFVKTTAEFDALMNQVGYSTGGAKGSVKDYYLENSYGLMNLQVSVIGPVTLPKTASYYATHQREFANAVVNISDPLVDYSQFANNRQVESFHIIFAGYGDEAIGNEQQIWSHAWTLGSTVTKDGVNLSRYSCSPELHGSSGSNITYIGVIAHELAHVFGSPDYYDVSSNNGGTDFIGTGKWDLMAGGSWNDSGRQPATINPYQKIQFAWMIPQIFVVGNSVSNMPPSADSPVVYKIMANSNGEHYLLENKQLIGFDASLPGHGLLIWHIAASVANYAPNENHPLQVYPVCASSTTAIPSNTTNSYGSINSAGCPFPGTSGKTEFTDNSIPQAFTWAGLTGINRPIINIIEHVNQTVSFGPPYISGPSTVCYNDSSAFTLNNSPAGTITWSVTAPFTVSGNGLTAKVVRTGTDNTNGTLTANINGNVVTTKTITPCISTISGSSIVCPGGTATFTASNVPAGYTWGYSSNLTPIPGSPGSFKASSSTGSAWVSVRQGPVEIARRTFSIYTTVSITGPSTIYPATPGVFYSNSPCDVSYKWELATVDPSTLVMGTPVVVGTNYAVGIQTGPPQSVTPKHYLLSLTVRDKFGNSQFTTTAFSIYGEAVVDPNLIPNGRSLPVSPIGVNAFPNPVSDTLHIEIDAPADVVTQDTKTYEIFLCDEQGTLVLREKTQDSKVQLDVSGFPNGFYDLIIYDEVNKKFDKRQIVVKN